MYQENGVKFDFFEVNGGTVDVYITAIVFALYQMDLEKDLVNEEYLKNGTVFNTKGIDVAYTDGAFVLSSTENAQADFNSMQNYFEISADIVAYAISQGYTNVVVNMTTANELICSTGTGWVESRGSGTISRTLGQPLSKYTSGIRFNFQGGGVVNVTINSILFTK